MITNDDLVFLAENYICNLTPIVQDCPTVTGHGTHGQCIVKLKSKTKTQLLEGLNEHKWVAYNAYS